MKKTTKTQNPGISILIPPGMLAQVGAKAVSFKVNQLESLRNVGVPAQDGFKNCVGTVLYQGEIWPVRLDQHGIWWLRQKGN